MPNPTVEDLIHAYMNAETIPEDATPAERESILVRRRKEALTAFHAIQEDAQEIALANHYAYRPELTASVAVLLSEETDWEAVANWCGGTIDSGPDGTPSGEWNSWINLPGGESAVSGTWIVKTIEGTFQNVTDVLEPDETSLLQAKAEGWEQGAATALNFANYTKDGSLALAIPNPGAALLQTKEGPAAEHQVSITLTPGEGVRVRVACHAPLGSVCLQEDAVHCNVSASAQRDPAAFLSAYQGSGSVALATLPFAADQGGSWRFGVVCTGLRALS